jgi:hypothetical protein
VLTQDRAAANQMLLAVLRGDGQKPFYPNHFLTWKAARALQLV